MMAWAAVLTVSVNDCVAVPALLLAVMDRP